MGMSKNPLCALFIDRSQEAVHPGPANLLIVRPYLCLLLKISSVSPSSAACSDLSQRLLCALAASGRQPDLFNG
jgi:hypothetical protein